MRSNKTIILTGLISSLGASLCCIGPILAVMSIFSSSAVNYSLIETGRPYLIGITILCLGYSFYSVYSKKSKDCCATQTLKRPISEKTMVWLAASFAIASFAFPYITLSANETNILKTTTNLVTLNYSVAGMTCSGCENHITTALANYPGVNNVKVNYSKKKADITLDTLVANQDSIIAIIKKTGYSATFIGYE